MPQFPHLLTVYENVTFLLGLLRSLGEMIQVTQLPVPSVQQVLVHRVGCMWYVCTYLSKIHVC